MAVRNLITLKLYRKFNRMFCFIDVFIVFHDKSCIMFCHVLSFVYVSVFYYFYCSILIYYMLSTTFPAYHISTHIFLKSIKHDYP